MEESLTLEEIRARNIAANAAFLQEHGLSLGKPLIASQLPPAEPKAIRPYVRKQQPVEPARRSVRTAGKEAPKYDESVLDLDDPDRPRQPRPVKRRKVDDSLALGVFMPSLSDNGREVYYDQHKQLLGTCKVKWPHCNFEKTYDKISGTCCHQCRQKTIDPKTRCSRCQSGFGMFCGTCLQHRYGENLDEVLQRTDWTCPRCRGICNCSICRNHAGLPATGIAIHHALNAGYDSVAHYLVNKYYQPGPCPRDMALDQAAHADALALPAGADNDSMAIVPFVGSDVAPAAPLQDAVRQAVAEAAEDASITPPGSVGSSPSPVSKLARGRTPRSAAKRATDEAGASSTGAQFSAANASAAPSKATGAGRPKVDMRPGQLVACRPDPSSNAKIWIAEVKEVHDSAPKGGKRKLATVVVEWYEKDENFQEEVYRRTKLVDEIPVASIFHSGFKLNRRLTPDGVRWQPKEDLTKYDV